MRNERAVRRRNDDAPAAPITSVTAAQRLEFRQQGFLVVDSGLSDSTIQALVDELEPFWGPGRAVPDGAAMSLPNRIQDYWRVSRLVHAVATAPSIIGALAELDGRTPRPFQTLNFNWGTSGRSTATASTSTPSRSD